MPSAYSKRREKYLGKLRKGEYKIAFGNKNNLKHLGSERLADFKKEAVYSQIYEFFGHKLGIKSNSSRVLKDFRHVYGRFERSGEGSRANTLICYIILAKSPEDHYLISWKGNLYRMNKEEADPLFFIFKFLIEEVKDYFLLHAGAVSWRDRGLIISAPCGFGKTTLIIELVKRGLCFLSDELAPIHRLSHLVEPFPRSLGLRTEGSNQTIMDIKEIFPARIGKTCLCKYMVFLDLPRENFIDNSQFQTIEVAFNRIDDLFLDELKGIPGIRKVSRIEERLFPMVRLSLKNRVYFYPKLQQMSQKRGISIMYSLPSQSKKPDYTGSPSLRHLSPRQGLIRLTQSVINREKSKMLNQTYQGSITRMLTGLADVARESEFYRLCPGRLKETSEILDELVRAKG